LVEEHRVPGWNHRPAASHWLTSSHNIVLSTPILVKVVFNTVTLVNVSINMHVFILCMQIPFLLNYTNNACYLFFTPYSSISVVISFRGFTIHSISRRFYGLIYCWYFPI
jgi:hypothetical protein